MTLINKKERYLLHYPEESGCYWDAKEYGLKGDAALSAALSCDATHKGTKLVYYNNKLMFKEKLTLVRKYLPK